MFLIARMRVTHRKWVALPLVDVMGCMLRLAPCGALYGGTAKAKAVVVGDVAEVQNQVPAGRGSARALWAGWTVAEVLRSFVKFKRTGSRVPNNRVELSPPRTRIA